MGGWYDTIEAQITYAAMISLLAQNELVDFPLF